MSNVVLNILSEFKGKKAFKQADSAISKLEKSAKNLGATLGVTLGTAAVVSFGKVTVKAFMEDQKAAAQLSNTVKNLGLAFADTDIQKFVEKLSLATGVADDELRPAMQKLLQVTGSVAKSQDLLKNAIDISKGSGTDLATVAADLSNAYVGNNKGLKKYALGLTAAELKTASFDKVLQAFNRNFKGAGAADLKTLAGQFGLITNSAKEAEETIGGGLVDAFKILVGNTGISNLSTKIGELATNIADFFRGLAIGFRDLANMPVIKQLLQLTGLMLQVIGKAAGFFIDPFVKAGKESRSTGYGDFAGSTDAFTRAKNAKAAAKAEADAKKRAKELLAAQTKNTAELKKQAALKKDGTIFDMQQIELIAALKGKLSDDERRRAELQLALLNENVTEADILTKQILMAQDATGNLYKYFQQTPDAKNPFAYLDKWILDFQTKLNALNIPNLAVPSTYTGQGIDPNIAALGVTAGYGANIPQTGDPSTVASNAVLNGLYGMQSTAGFVDTSSVTGTNVKVYVSGSVVTEQELVDAIQSGLQSNSLSGAPSQIGRIAGMFG
jgi:hypothetical protein